jgi:hypothetical protein|tara:strand:- start:5578 stop:6024 length:447 start_codon:yes stop_codon:yes gene_type:complete
MDNKAIIKKLKIKKCFAYHEEKKSEEEVEFGWKNHSLESLSLPFVVSYASKSKNISDEDKKWSKEAGVNAASLEDYKRYFTALTGDEPDLYLETWGNKPSELEDVRRALNPKYKDGEGLFLISLAKLITKGGRFSQYGRVYKLIEQDT